MPSLVNDVHSGLNATRVREVIRPSTVEELAAAVASGRRFAVSGGRHAMGGQQFLADEALLDLRGLDRVLDVDYERGWVTAEAGVEWPALMEGYLRIQREKFPRDE